MFGEVVRGHRRRRAWTQEVLAERTGISVRSIRNIEAGHIHTPRAGTLRLLADAFELEGAERDRFFSLSQEAATSAAASPVGQRAARFSLPPDVAGFTGRTAELAAIAATATRTAPRVGVVAIHAIEGMPGVGKTTLAVHAAHQLADRYPDGQVFVDLHAHTSGLSPADPADALADLLRADGVDPRQLPDSLDARAALWRDRMAGRRALIVLDNVRSTVQVSPLLPGSDTVLVLITSRRRLGDLPHAAHLHLNVLPHTDAVRMFTRLAPRAADEPGADNAVAELVQMCEYLPSAISILASRYAAHPTWTTHDLLAEFRTTRERLLTVKSENATVNAAFDLSYQHLPPQRQRFFRLLGLTPGVDIDCYAAAALTGTNLEDAIGNLDELYNDHLLDETGPRRYRMHDLVRAYTRVRATATEPDHARERAVDRLLAYYEHTAKHADALIADYDRPAATSTSVPAARPDLSRWDDALAWLRIERPNLEACLQYATSGRRYHRVVGLAAGLSTLLHRDGPWSQAADLYERAAYAAARTGDRVGQATALQNLGTVRRLAGDNPTADNLLHQALTIYTETGNRHGEANTLTELGRVRRVEGDYPAANDLLCRALTIHVETGNRLGQASTLNTLANLRWLAGDYTAAADMLCQALAIHTETGNRHGQATTLYELGVVRWLTGDYPAADTLFHEALTIYIETGNLYGQASALSSLGVARRLIGDYSAAADILCQALSICKEIGSRHGQANTLHHLGVVRRLTGDHVAAESLLNQALASYTEIGHRHGEALTWTQLGVVRYLTGEYSEAEDLLQQAVAVLKEIGVPDDEAEALNHLGTLCRLTARPDKADIYHTEALTLSRRIRHRLHEANALEGIGRAALDQGDPMTATSHLRQALHLYQELGLPEANEVAATLQDIEPAPDDRDGLLSRQ